MADQLISRPNNGMVIRPVEIVHPGVAFAWTEASTGLKIMTNIKPEEINNRTVHPILFATEAEVWAWAKRIQRAQRL